MSSRPEASYAAAPAPLTTPTFGPATTGKVGMWIFLVTDAMTFGGLLLAYGILRAGNTQWPTPTSILGIPFTAVMTFVLIVSSLTMVLALDAAKHGNAKQAVRWLLATASGGVFFLCGQIYEYRHLIHEGLLPSGIRDGSALAARLVDSGKLTATAAGLFGSAFFTMTGFHGFHVTCGVICMTFVTIKAFRGGYSGGRFKGVEVIGLYWHFVDLVWIILFTIVYLI